MSDPRFIWDSVPAEELDGTLIEGEVCEGVRDTETGVFYGFTHPLIPYEIPESMKLGIIDNFVNHGGVHRFTPTRDRSAS